MSFRVLFGLVASLVLTAACGKSDADITESIKSQLAADDTVQALNIDVETHERVVTLSGSADRQGERDRAAEIARATDGVTEVLNNITVVSAATQADAVTSTSGEAAQRPELPRTASLLPLAALIGAISLIAAILLTRLRQRWTVGRP